MRLYLAIALLFLAACGPTLVPRRAEYLPEHHAWGVHWPKGTFTVLRDPFTSCALQCRDEVVRWRDALSARAMTRSRKESAMSRALAYTWPLAVPAGILALPAYGISKALESRPAAELLKQADLLWQNSGLANADRAADLYVQAWLHGESAALDKLAQVWIAQGKRRDAVKVRQAELCWSSETGVYAWERVTSWLASEGAAPLPCDVTSLEPVDVLWPE